jgi:O-antigen/teichoic acid export membrane protein
VAVLFFSTRLPQMAQQQLVAVGNASWAGMADLHHRGEHETFRRRLLELFQLVAILGVAAVGPIAAYHRQFLALWVGPDLDGGDLVALAAGANALLVPLVSLSGWCVAGTGRVRMLAGPSLISAALNLSSSIVLAYFVGVAGPLLGTTATILGFGLWYQVWLLHRVFGVPLAGLARSVGLPLGLGLPYVAAWWWLAASQGRLGWLGLAAQMAASACGFLALASAVALTTAERAAWRGRIGALLGRIQGPFRREAADLVP